MHMQSIHPHRSPCASLPSARGRITTAIVAAACVLAGCSTGGAIPEADRLALYRAHAGAPVASASQAGSPIGWTPLGDMEIALWTGPSRAYLVRFIEDCPDIRSATAIRVTNQAGRVYPRFDHVVPLGGSTIHAIPCRIAEIRPLDTQALRAEERDLRQARAEARQGSGT